VKNIQFLWITPNQKESTKKIGRELMCSTGQGDIYRPQYDRRYVSLQIVNADISRCLDDARGRNIQA